MASPVRTLLVLAAFALPLAVSCGTSRDSDPVVLFNPYYRTGASSEEADKAYLACAAKVEPRVQFTNDSDKGVVMKKLIDKCMKEKGFRRDTY